MLVLKDEITLRKSDHTYWMGGRYVPGVTEIIKFFLRTYYPPNIDFQIERGREAHRCIELLELGKLDPFSVDPNVQPYLTSYERLRDRMKPKIKNLESRLYNEARDYCGTMDATWVIKGVEILVDYKTGIPQFPDVEYQLGAYDNCLPKNPGRKRAAIHLMGDGSEAKLIMMKEPLAGALFNGLAANYHFLIDSNRVKIPMAA